MRHLIRTLMLCLGLAASFGASSARADEFPSKPIKLIMPYAPGGGTDAVAAVFTDKLAQKLGQPVVKENHPGSNSVIGTTLLTKAEPDGHTLLVVTSAFVNNPYIYANLPYETPGSFAPVAILTAYPFVLGVREGLPFDDVQGLIDYAKANPGTLTAGTSGRGASAQLALGLFNESAGIKIRDIPFKGAGESLNAVAGGFVDMVFSGYETVRPFVESGRMKPLASTGPDPLGAERIPPIAATIPGFNYLNWLALLAPAGTPPDVVEKINVALKEIFAEQDVQDRLARLNVQAIVSTPDEARDHIVDQMAVNKGIIESIGLKPQ